MKFQNYLLNTLNQSSSRIRRLRATISGISNYIENILDDIYPNFKNIVNKIPAPTNTKVREKSVFKEEQLQELLDYLVENKEYLKACVLALAIASGSRKSELLRFKVSYFTDENIIYGSLYKTPEKIKTKGAGKGKFLFKYILLNKFKKYLDLWLSVRNTFETDKDDLFLVKKNDEYEDLKISTLNCWAKQFGKILGCEFYFHSMRHFFTTYLAESNIPDSVIQEIVGWQNLEMVKLYKDIETDEEIVKYFNDGEIKQIQQKSISDL
jgi:integrase